VLALALPLLLGATGLLACSSCPPAWVEHLPQDPGWIYGAGTCGRVFVDVDATALALSRAARGIADALGLDVERRLSVRRLDGRLFVEAVGPQGPLADLDALQLVELVQCDETVHALLRLPRPVPPR